MEISMLSTVLGFAERFATLIFAKLHACARIQSQVLNQFLD
jgi:hypothetical protein